MENKDIGDSAQSQQGFTCISIVVATLIDQIALLFSLNVYDVINKKFGKLMNLSFYTTHS